MLSQNLASYCRGQLNGDNDNGQMIKLGNTKNKKSENEEVDTRRAGTKMSMVEHLNADKKIINV